MNKYEIMYILKSTLDDEAKEATVEKYKALICSEGGEVESVNKIGTKKFAYEIDFKSDGYYVLMLFSSSTSFIQELERRMRIDESVVRFMVTKK